MEKIILSRKNILLFVLSIFVGLISTFVFNQLLPTIPLSILFSIFGISILLLIRFLLPYLDTEVKT